ncbi:serine protease [Streptomyces sp. CB01201]|uniref:proprotein convertase P-domain-containing protein n=1 Tax=Streptomyces sp. CB01201 TaxID=2020324 RepID=UPI000C2726DF|nr:proprotein convertase P-domain-containing protein [Streptomyces sp. CB01201]PJM98005.1 serine protease [Streptomyces sp. CB01201]
MKRPLWAAVIAGAITIGFAVLPTTAQAGDLDPVGTVDPVSSATYKAAEGGKKIRVNVVAVNRSDLSAAAEAGQVVRTFKKVPVTTLRVDTTGLKKLSADPGVLSVTEDVPVPPSLDQTVPLVGADKTTAKGLDGSGSTVAILDTGVAVKHPFLGGRVTDEACFSTTDETYGSASLCPGGTDVQEGPGSADADSGHCAEMGDACSHGTHVAGIAAGNGTGLAGAPKQGVAPGAKIIAIQVFSRFDSPDYCGSVTPCALSFTSDQLAALEKVDAYKQAGKPVIAVNLSLGGGRYTAACDADPRAAIINTLYNEGVATVAAAGNQAYTNAVNSPACVPNAVTVGAVTDDDQLTSYTNRGPLVDVFAPGQGVISSLPGSTYGSKNGTSMATPHVTGALAVLRQAAPDASLSNLVKTLASTGKAISYTEATTPRIQVGAAADTLAAKPDPKPRPTMVWDEKDSAIPGKGSGSLTRQLTSTVPGNAPSRLRLEFDVDGLGLNNLNVDLIDPNGKTYHLDDSATPAAATPSGIEAPSVGGPIGSAYYVDASSSPASGTWKLKLANGYSTSVGTLLNWSLEFPFSKLGNVSIPDNGNISASVSAANVGGNASSATQVSVNLTHQKIGDLKLELISPSSKTYVLKTVSTTDTTTSVNKTYIINASDSPADGTWNLKVTDSVTGSIGTLKSWSVAFPTYENRTSVAIPDQATVATGTDIWRSSGTTPTKAKVWVDLDHEWQGDLNISLLGPGGKLYPLKAVGIQPGGHMQKLFTVDIPAQPISGEWQLQVEDTDPGSTGTLNGWVLQF